MEEALVVVTAATGALGPVVANLSTLLRRDSEYKLRRGTRKDIKRIRSKLKSIHSILWVIWEREDLDEEGKELRMEAWRLADDMSDAIDDFILSMKRSNDGKSFIEAKIQHRPFEDLKIRVVDVSERCHNRWKIQTSQITISSLFSRTKTTVDDSAGHHKRHRVVDPYVPKDISAIVGMEGPREKIMEHLIGEEESTQQLKMASILGAAGMGKTTLARLVYEAIEDKFEARAFVSVISSHNMTEVLARIYQQVQGLAHSTIVPLAGTKATTTVEKHLIHDISNFLKDKRYLVIIDDIWHYREWEIIKKSLPDNNHGSRIVTTTRVESMTEKSRQDFETLVHKLIFNTSSDDELIAWRKIEKMFHMNADMVGEGIDQYDLNILDMCRDMPLAVACMVSALTKERERQEQPRQWTLDLQNSFVEQVWKDGIQNTPGFEPLVESLELGYKDLPHHMLKTCLLYCSIYPEGCKFTRDELVRRWIGQGFVHKEEVAKDYFDELVSRSFITDGSMHPMMRNYLRRKLQEGNFITCTSYGVPSSPVGRLCIDYWPTSSEAVDTLSGIWHHIRSLVVFRDAERVPYKNLEKLRVFDVQVPRNGVFENQHLKDMCGLLRLRHLLVSRSRYVQRNGITEMPAEIARLQHLETLQVHGTRITRLPTEMGNLKHLESLIISQSNIREQAWEIILTLKKLKTLVMSNNRELSRIPRDIGELQHLKNLNLSATGITELPKEIGKLQHLETLDLSQTQITQLPREIGNLQRLQVLNLKRVRTITKLPRDIGKLQHLEALGLRHSGVRKIPREIGGLKKLKNLNVDFGTLPFEAGKLSKLEGLPNCVWRIWKNSDLVSSLAGEILSFSKTTWWTGDGGLTVGTKHMHIPLWIKEYFNNICSLDIRICKLEEQDLKILRDMPHLNELKLRFEAVPRKPVAISGGGFAKLQYLTVDSRVPRITFQEGAMSRLEWLTFEFQFYGGPPNTDHPMGIKHLVRLEYVSFQCNEWYRADSPCISATIDVMRKEAREHPNEIRLYVSGVREIFPANSITQSSQDRNDEACSSSGAQEIEEIQA